jgi:simple sugar transport system ATP-binding protein
MFAGEFMGIFDSNDDRLCDIGLMMAGSKRYDPDF